jgi:hypothetical protein
MVAGSQSHGCWQPITWFVGRQPHSCWQPKAWLLAANHMVVGSPPQPKSWLLAAKNMVAGSQPHGCWQLRVMLAWYQKRYSSVQKKKLFNQKNVTQQFFCQKRYSSVQKMVFNQKKCYPTTFFFKKTAKKWSSQFIFCTCIF